MNLLALQTWKARACSCLLVFILAAPASVFCAIVPATLECEVDGVVTGPIRLTGGVEGNSRSAAQAINLSILDRRALPFQQWYFEYGIQSDVYSFTGVSALPRRLQDVSGLFAISYFDGTEEVAALTVQPGWYFGHHLTRAAFDVPVEFTAGIPLADNINAVIGARTSRFFKHPEPIAGFVWQARPFLRIEATYPEPAVVWVLNQTAELRIGGDLSGAGFSAELAGKPAIVEYTSYRIGAEFKKTLEPGLQLSLGLGVEVERSFDYFREHQRFHGSSAPFLKIGVLFKR